MNIVIIIQARMTSSRLPGKIMKEVLGKPLLEYQIERLKQVKLADNMVIATTNNKTDEPVIQLCQRLQVLFFRGSEEDVLTRYYMAAKKHKADVIIRVCGDCPIIDPVVVDKLIYFYFSHSNSYDYVSNSLEKTYPLGMNAEIFSFKCLEEACNEAKENNEREHVTPFFYLRPDRYHLANIKNEEDLSKYRLTVDTKEDFFLVKKIIEEFYPLNPLFSLQDCLDLLRNNPELQRVNAHVEQRKI